MARDMEQRVFLFLQGSASPLFRLLAKRLEDLECRCLRINLNAGDWFSWRRRGGSNYRGKSADWAKYVQDFMQAHSVTDLIVLGEERPYHRVAVAAAKARGATVSVIEMGYLRPDWVTIERDGMSSNSHFPNDPQQILDGAEGLLAPDFEPQFSQSFWAEAGYDLAYYLPSVFLRMLYPYYRHHGIFHPLQEYRGWVQRLRGAGHRAKMAEAIVAMLDANKTPFFVFPLQLQTDFQLRAHSNYHGQEEAISEVIASFAANAAPSSQLVLKVHPLENGLIDWAGLIQNLAAEHGVSDRVKFTDGGSLDRLLGLAAGMVTINSTSAIRALQKYLPVKVLGSAIFDVAGMTSQVSLSDFWQRTERPDKQLVDAFFKLLAASIQERGNFYSLRGARAASEAIAQRLMTRRLNMPGAFIDPPPRRLAENHVTRIE